MLQSGLNLSQPSLKWLGCVVKMHLIIGKTIKYTYSDDGLLGLHEGRSTEQHKQKQLKYEAQLTAL